MNVETIERQNGAEPIERSIKELIGAASATAITPFNGAPKQKMGVAEAHENVGDLAAEAIIEQCEDGARAMEKAAEAVMQCAEDIKREAAEAAQDLRAHGRAISERIAAFSKMTAAVSSTMRAERDRVKQFGQ